MGRLDQTAIRSRRPDHDARILDLILRIQRDEFGLAITAADQPDLLDIDAAYLANGGAFWVAETDADRIVGTIAAMPVDANTAVIRKMFVAAEQRGTGLADALMDTVVSWARATGLPMLLLGTTAVMERAHRFYDRHGFVALGADELPDVFPRMAVDTEFYRRDLAGVVSLRAYDPTWPEVYSVERDRLIGALGDRISLVEHVGSTSVPGLVAKPCIDIVVTVDDPSDEPGYLPDLTELGYRLAVREPEWFEHRCLRSDWPRVNLHVFGVGCPEVERMLAFRDRLRTDVDARNRYAGEKRRLAAREWAEVQEYADAKSAVVTEIIGRPGLA